MGEISPSPNPQEAMARLLTRQGRIKLEFMERLAFLEKRTRLLFAQGALLRAQASSLSFQPGSAPAWAHETRLQQLLPFLLTTNVSNKSGNLLFARSYPQ
jgi:hypothetical protein